LQLVHRPDSRFVFVFVWKGLGRQHWSLVGRRRWTMKKQKKEFAWYRGALGLREPFHVVVAASAVSSLFGEQERGVGVERVARELAQTCGGPCSIALTGCVLAALQGLPRSRRVWLHTHGLFVSGQGRDALPTIMAAKRGTIRIDCAHAQPLPFAECVAALHEQQSGFSVVALVSQLEEVRAVNHAVLGVPVLQLLADGKFKVCSPTTKTRELAVELGLKKVTGLVLHWC
jgi:hypothetical protein